MTIFIAGSGYLRRSITIGGLATILSAVVGISLAPLLVRQIGIENYGIWAFLASFSGLSAIVDIGLARAVSYYVVRARHLSSAEHAFSTGLSMLAGLAALLFAAAGLFALLGPFTNIKVFDIHESVISAALIYGLVIMGLLLLINFFRAFLEARMKIHLAQALTLVFHLLNYGSANIVSWFTQDITVLIQLTCFVHLVALVLYVLISLRQGWPAWRRPTRRVAVILLGRSLGYFVMGLANLVTLPLNRILLVSLGGPTAHALFDLGLKVAMGATALLQTINAPLFSVYATLVRKDLKAVFLLAVRMTGVSLLLYLLGMSFLFFASDIIARLLMAENSTVLKEVLLILVGGIAFTGVGEPAMRAFWAIGRERTVAAIRTASLFANIAIALSLRNIDPVTAISIAYGAPLFLGAFLQIGMLVTLQPASRHGSS